LIVASRRTYSITTTLAFAMGTLVAIGLLVVLGLGLSSGQRNTENLLRDWAVATVSSATALVELEMAPVEAQLKYLGDLVASGRVSTTNRRQLTDVLTGSLAAAPQISAITFIDPELRILSVRRAPDSGAPVVVGEDWSDRPGVRELVARVRAGGRPVWGEIIVSPDESTGALVNLRMPLEADNEFVGGLVAAVSVSQLSRFVDNLSDDVGGNAFILYGEQFVLAHRALSAGYKPKTPFHVLPEIGEVGDPALAAIWEGRERRALSNLLGGRRVLSRLGFSGHVGQAGGQTYLYLYKKVETYGPIPWYVGTYMTTASFADELQRLTLAGVAGLVVLVVSLAAALWIGRRVACPIKRVAAAANLVSGFQFDQVGELPPSRIKEIDDQSRAFNAMVTGLHWFQNYVPRRLVKRLMEEGGSREGVRSMRRTLTLMFTDIAGFTTQSEAMPADQVAGFLNEHFALTAACVEAERGTIDKYIGDAMMAFWGAPGHQEDHAERALRAALAIVRALRDDNARRRSQGQPAIRMRIGLHTGDVVVGNIGSPGRVNYTIVGDAVNVGQRLEQLGNEVMSPQEDVVVLLSEDTMRRVPTGMAPLEPIGERRVKGREQALKVYRLL
jgi:class 3 adenylate cyclase